LAGCEGSVSSCYMEAVSARLIPGNYAFSRSYQLVTPKPHTRSKSGSIAVMSCLLDSKPSLGGTTVPVVPMPHVTLALALLTTKDPVMPLGYPNRGASSPHHLIITSIILCEPTTRRYLVFSNSYLPRLQPLYVCPIEVLIKTYYWNPSLLRKIVLETVVEI